MKRSLPVPVLLTLAALAWPATAEAAAPCECDHLIENDALLVLGSEVGVKPGESVCVRGGDRPWLRLQEFVGAEGQPVEIRNCEGQVNIDNDDKGYGLTVERSRYVRVTGSGDPDHMYGFKVRAARTGPDYSASGVIIGDLSSDIEADHIESYDSGFAGFIVKTDPRCDGSANLGEFVMYDSKIHHNYMHDTRGEGIYFGSTGYGGREYTCDGEKILLYPHEHRGAQIHDNLIENTGWDGAQIGVTPEDCAFYRNVIRNVGLEGVQYQQQGLQVGGGSACSIWGNVLIDGPTNGLFIFGIADTDIYNNLVVGFAGAGIYINDQGLDFDANVRVVHNTVHSTGDRGIVAFGALLGASEARNNVVTGSGELLAVGNEIPDFVVDGNITAEDPGTLGFVDVASDDFHLLEDSPLRDAGLDLPGLTVDDDLDGTPRDDGALDVGAFEYSETPPTTGTDSDSDSGSDSDASTTGDTGTTDGSAGTGGAESESTSATGGGTEGSSGSASSSESATSTASASASATETAGEGGEDETDGCACRSVDDRDPSPALFAPLLLLLRRRRTSGGRS